MSLIASTSKAGAGAPDTIVTDPIDTTGAKFIIALVASYSAVAPGTFTDNKGNVFTPLTQVAGALCLHYKIAPIVGPNHIFTTPTLQYPSVSVLAFDDTVIGLDAESGAAASQPGAITPGRTNELFVLGAQLDGAVPATVDSGFTKDGGSAYIAGQSVGNAIAHKNQVPQTALNPSWSTAVPGAVMAAFKTAAQGGLVTSVSADGVTSPAVTAPIDTTGAKFLVASISGYAINQVAPATVTDSKGNVWKTLRVSQSAGPTFVGDYRTQLFCCETPTVGAGHTFTGTSSYGNFSIHVLAFDYSGLEFIRDVGGNCLSSQTACPAGSISAFLAGRLFISSATNFAGSSFAVDSGFTIGAQILGSGPSAIAYKKQSAAGTESPIWTVAAEGSGRGQAAVLAMFGVPASRLKEGLISWWKMDEPSGDALDSHGSNNLTAVNAPGSAVGKVGGARDLEIDNSQYFTLADNAALSLGDIDFTYALWIKPETLGYGGLISKGGIIGSGQVSHRLYGGPGGLVAWEMSPAGVNMTGTVSAASTIAVGNWFFIIAEYNAAADTMSLQINNAAPAVSTLAGGAFDDNGSFWLGTSPNLASFDGLMDEVAFWKRILTPAEKTFLYNGGNGRTYRDLTPSSGMQQMFGHRGGFMPGEF